MQWRKHGVASFTDAWIETFVEIPVPDGDKVASFTDAWIETMGIFAELVG